MPTLPFRAATALLSLTLASCGWNTRQPPTTSVDTAGTRLARQTEVTMREDLTTGKVVFYGMPTLSPDADPGVPRQGQRLKSELARDSKDCSVTHWVVRRVHWVGSGIDHWTKAEELGTDPNGKPVALKLGVPSLNVGTCARTLWTGCDHDEEVSAQIPASVMQAALQSGLRVRFVMNQGREYLAEITKEQAAAQVARVQAWCDRPQPPATQATAPQKVFLVMFDFDRSDLSAEAQEVVMSAAKAAKKGYAVQIDLAGHADRAGTENYNMGLSLRRAQAVKDAMAKLGLTSDSMAVSGKGETAPQVATPDGIREQRNRRVEIILP